MHVAQTPTDGQILESGLVVKNKKKKKQAKNLKKNDDGMIFSWEWWLQNDRRM